MSRPKATGNPIRKEDEVVVVDQEEEGMSPPPAGRSGDVQS